jgi:hypothetical protein
MYFAVFADGVFYSPAAQKGMPARLRFYRFADRSSSDLMSVNGGLGSGLSVSPDRKWVLFAPAQIRQGDIYFVENFR